MGNLLDMFSYPDCYVIVNTCYVEPHTDGPQKFPLHMELTLTAGYLIEFCKHSRLKYFYTLRQGT
jgi:hypothetical protein